MIAILRESKMYLYDDSVAFFADKEFPKNGFFTVGIIKEVHNRSSQEVIL